ncbi:MAG: DMT family transporter [Thermomicrobium sp.]|nr:DMT family transporter [Thermomicrobium sp.]MDW8059968.1 DMT family transporter [Thermomicrobium sp.]
MRVQRETIAGARREFRDGLLFATVGVLAVSTSAVLIRLAQGISSFEIAFWRLSIATLVLVPFVLQRGVRQEAARVGWRRLAVYGGVLALHFVAYIGALQLAPVAHVLPLLYTSTIMLAVLSALLLREPLRRLQLVGIVIVLLGVTVLTGFEPRLTLRTVLGDGLALVSAAAYAAYSLIGRRERARLPLFVYATAVYGFAALWVLPLAVGAALRSEGMLDRYDGRVIAALLGLGLIPNTLGHTLYNAAVRRLNAAVTNVIYTQEMTGAIVLAWLVLGEVPSLNAIAGAAVMLAGILLVLLG